MSLLQEVGEICSQPEQLHIEWRVKNVSSLSKSVDVCYTSPLFYLLGQPFYIKLYLNGESRNGTEGSIGLFLMSWELCTSMEVEFSIGFKTTEGEIKQKFTLIYTFAKKIDGFGNSRALSRSKLQSFVTPSDVLTISATLKLVPKSIKDNTIACIQRDAEDTGNKMDICRPSGTTDVCIQTDAGDTGNWKSGSKSADTVDVCIQADAEDNENIKAGCQPTGGEKILEAIEKLWDSGENSDVVIHVGDVEFKAHRAILGVRTPVLSAMFQHDTIEKTTGVVTISDCEPTVFEELLHYIYTGAPKELTTKNAPSLYALANKYLVGELKTQCLNCIISKLCVETFCDTVLLALNYGEAELLELAIEFASKNFRKIIRSKEWQRFIREHSDKANEILIKAFGPE